MFAKVGYRGKRFSVFDRSGSDTEFFNEIGSEQTPAAHYTKDRSADAKLPLEVLLHFKR